jgi:hypothetical protein
LQPSDGAGLAWAYANARVLEQRSTEHGIHLVIAADPQAVERFTARFGDQVKIAEEAQHRRAVSS